MSRNLESNWEGRIKLIICQIRHELSVVIREISTSWKKMLDGGPCINNINKINLYLVFFNYFKHIVWVFKNVFKSKALNVAYNSIFITFTVICIKLPKCWYLLRKCSSKAYLCHARTGQPNNVHVVEIKMFIKKNVEYSTYTYKFYLKLLK